MHVRFLPKQAGITRHLGPCSRLAYFYPVGSAKQSLGYEMNCIQTSVHLAVFTKSLPLKLWNRSGGQARIGSMIYPTPIFHSANFYYSKPSSPLIWRNVFISPFGIVIFDRIAWSSKFDHCLWAKSLCALKMQLCGSGLRSGWSYLLSNFKKKSRGEVLGNDQNSLFDMSTGLGVFIINQANLLQDILLN